MNEDDFLIIIILMLFINDIFIICLFKFMLLVGG